MSTYRKESWSDFSALTMEPINSISISETRELSNPSKHTVYIISIKGPVRTWSVSHRYSEFHALHTELSQIQEPPEQLPKKTFLNFQNDVINQRKQELERYLQAILYSKNAIWRRSKPWHQFLQLPETNIVDSLNSKPPKIVNALGWTQELETLLSFLGEIQGLLNDCDRFTLKGDTSASQTSKFQARKGLRLANATFEQLQSSLTESATTNELTHGEVSRRQNLLQNVGNQLRNLENLASQTTFQKANQPHSEHSEARKQLFESSKPKSSRKFGVMETEATRVLDNAGLLQLQTDQMKMQDQVVDSLASVVKRQKEISLAISHELDLQNGLLEQVNDSVERVQGNMNQAQKKIRKVLNG